MLFGSFNPVHAGHLIIAQYFATQAGLHEVWFVVSPHNPFKETSALASGHHRLAMVQLAVEDNELFHACDMEFKMQAPSYTIDTLNAIRQSLTQLEFVLLMGEDNLATFHQWKNYEEILSQHEIFVYPRLNSADKNQSPIKWDAHRVKFFPAPRVEISATRLRAMIAAGLSTRYLMPEAVRQYIESRNLFRS